MKILVNLKIYIYHKIYFRAAVAWWVNRCATMQVTQVTFPVEVRPSNLQISSRCNEYRIIPGSPMIRVVPIDRTSGMTARKVPSIPGRQVAPRPTNLREPYGSVV